MKFKPLVLIYLLLFFGTLSAQFIPKDKKSYRANFIEGSLLLEEGNPLMALEYFKFARNYDSLNANINYLVGYCPF